MYDPLMTLCICYEYNWSIVAELVEHQTGDSLGVASLRLTAGGVTVLYPSARHFIGCLLVLVQPMETGNCPNMAENIADSDVNHHSKQTKTITGDKNISILHLSCRRSDLQFSLVRQHMYLSFKSKYNKEHKGVI